MQLSAISESRGVSSYLGKLAAASAGHQTASIGRVPVVVVNPSRKRTILITAGIHGDEKAGPLALLKLLSKPPTKHRLVVLPLLNPIGYAANTRESHGKDLNRSFGSGEHSELHEVANRLVHLKADLHLSLHEDDTQDHVYAYYSDSKRKDFCKRMLRASSKGFGISPQQTIHGDQIEDGLILVQDDDPDAKHAKSLEMFLKKRQSLEYIVFETPGGAVLPRRIACQLAALRFVAENF